MNFDIRVHSSNRYLDQDSEQFYHTENTPSCKYKQTIPDFSIVFVIT